MLVFHHVTETYEVRAPRVLYLNTICSSVISRANGLLYYRLASYALDRRMCGPQSWPGGVMKENIHPTFRK
jgi:hypothetical protein